MGPGMLGRLAVLYALGIGLACPALLDAAEGEPGGAATTRPAEAPDGEDRAAAEAPPAEATVPAPATRAAPTQPAPGAPGAATPPDAAAPSEVPTATAATPAGSPVEAGSAAAGSVTMQDYRFSPSTVTVAPGDSVTWTNAGKQPHTATGDGFDTGTLKPGASGSATFSDAGSFAYVCSIHPNMRGTVRVGATSGPQGDQGSPGAAGSEPGGSGAGPGGSASDGASRPATASAGRPALPGTGLDAWLLGIVGVMLLATGIALRERTRPG